MMVECIQDGYSEADEIEYFCAEIKIFVSDGQDSYVASVDDPDKVLIGYAIVEDEIDTGR